MSTTSRGALRHLADADRGGIFNVTDDEPAPPQDVVAYAAALMGVEPPPEIAFETAELSPMARSFYGENKRVSNAAIKAAGYRFRYPDYRAALRRRCGRDGNWRGATDDARSPIAVHDRRDGTASCYDSPLVNGNRGRRFRASIAEWDAHGNWLKIARSSRSIAGGRC